MKNLKFFTILLTSVYFPLCVFAQNFQRQDQEASFFIPSQETAPHYENLPPVVQQDVQSVVRQQNTLYEVKYVLVDGVFVPTYTKVEIPVSEHVAKDEITIENHPSVIKSSQIKEQKNNFIHNTSSTEGVAPVVETKTQPEIKEVASREEGIKLPTYEKSQPGFPEYTTIYEQYLKDTLVFQKTKEFPYNQKLIDALNKMSSDKKHIIFQGPADSYK